MHNHQPSAACFRSPTFFVFDWPLHIGRLPRSPSQDHFPTSVFEALAFSIFSVHPALRGFAAVRFPPSPITWLRLLAWTHKRPSPATPVCLRVFCFSSVLFRVLYIHLAPLGPSLLIPTTAWQCPPSSTIFSCFALCLFLGSLHAFGSLARILALFLTMSAFPYREPASVSVFRARPNFSFLFPRSCRG